MKGLLLTCLFALTVSSFLFSQNERRADANRIPGQMLIQLESNASLETVLADLSRQAGAPITWVRTPAPRWYVHLLAFDETQVDADRLLALVRRAPGVALAQLCYRAHERNTEPNDDYWPQQDNMTLINAPKAWDSSVGGLTPGGDTIVVAVLENGLIKSHPDLAPNLWHNWAEVPYDNIDNDNNGYFDDFTGWDAQDEGDGNGNGSQHGTSTNGIIGAKGNNSIGVTGVNWNTKLMTLTHAAADPDKVVSAYYYAWDARRLYNETNGAEGAFVVATNTSFGIDWDAGGTVEQQPMWCMAFDQLGNAGILSAGATANTSIDVDMLGDIPSACPSEFLITVTAVDRFGKKSFTGYGNTSIDLGAPGIDVFSTINPSPAQPNNFYGNAGDGTSFATPHVAGAIALLYSMNCPSFTADALTNPAACARRVKQVIMDNVQPDQTLSGITVTGGYLDLARAAEGVRNVCGGKTGPLTITELRGTSDFGRNTLDLYYQVPDAQPITVTIHNALGQLIFEQALTPDLFSENHYQLPSDRFNPAYLPAAVYFVSIWRGDAVVTKKFLKF